MNRLSRRTLLVAGGGALLAACGGSKSGSSSATSAATGGGTGSAAAGPVSTSKLGDVDYTVVQFFKSGTIPPGIAHRLPFGLGDSQGVLEAKGPAAMDVRILDEAGKAEVVAKQQSVRHANGIQRPYWPVTVTLPAGTYAAEFSVGGKVVGDLAYFAVADTPKLPKVGDALPVMPTPTPANPQGVAPLCTRDPVCKLHDVSLDEVLGKGKPVVLLVATPAYCQTAVCGPMLDLMLGQLKSGVTYIHNEVWKTDKLDVPAPLLDAYAIDYEPVLFVADGAGKVTARLDVIWDVDDLNAAVATVA